MSGLEDRILTLVKELEEEKRLADKRAKQLYLAGATFIGHDDTPAAYAAQAGKFVKVNATPDALVFADIAAGDLPSHTHVKAHITDTPWAWTDVSKTGSNLTDLVTRQHAGLTNITSDQHHPQTHTLASHTSKDHHLLAGLADDDHSQYYNAGRHTQAVHNALNIDADKLDGYHGASASTANTFALRDASGDIHARLFRSEYDSTNATCNYIMTQIDTIGNNYLRPSTKAQLIASLNLMTKAGGTFSSHVYAADHPAAATDAIVNVCYGTGGPPTANTTTIGTLFVKYT